MPKADQGKIKGLGQREVKRRQTYAELLDAILERVNRHELKWFPSAPLELTPLKKKPSAEVICFGSTNGWVLKGWSKDISTVKPGRVLKLLRRKRYMPAVYRFVYINLIRTVVVIHTDGYAIMAEMHATPFR